MAAYIPAPLSTTQAPPFPTTQAQSPSGNKRKAGEIVSDDYDDESEEDDENMDVKWNCDQIRKKIKMFLATKEMTLTAFLDLIGCNSNSYGRFMKLKGGDSGSQNGVYWGAHKFFLQQESKNKRKSAAMTPTEKKRRAVESAARKGQSEELFAAVEKINLDESASIYDDCDDVRKKSLEFMAAHGISTAEFLRRIGNVNAKSWKDFVLMKGERKGASNSSYVKAYRFLEKLRMHNGEEKSAKRIKSEKDQPEGFPLKHDNGMHWVIG